MTNMKFVVRMGGMTKHKPKQGDSCGLIKYYSQDLVLLQLALHYPFRLNEHGQLSLDFNDEDTYGLDQEEIKKSIRDAKETLDSIVFIERRKHNVN